MDIETVYTLTYHIDRGDRLQKINSEFASRKVRDMCYFRALETFCDKTAGLIEVGHYHRVGSN